MAESTLSATRTELLEGVAFFLGYGRSATQANAEKAATITDCVKRGIRRVCVAYDWSWLKADVVLTLWASQVATTGVTVTGAGTTTLTGTGTAFASTMVGKTITITSVGNRTITAVASSTSITVDSAVAAGSYTFSIDADGSYRLPDLFAGTGGKATYTSPDYAAPLERVNIDAVRESLQIGNVFSRPTCYASRTVYPWSRATGERYELLVYPIPGVDYDVEFPLRLNIDYLSSGSDYIPGGMQFSELFMTSCLSVAEIAVNDAAGVKTADFKDQLTQAIEFDRRRTLPETVGSFGPGMYAESWRDRRELKAYFAKTE